MKIKDIQPKEKLHFVKKDFRFAAIKKDVSTLKKIVIIKITKYEIR